MFVGNFFEFPFLFWKNFPWSPILRKSSLLEIKLTLLHEDKLSENLKLSQTKIIEKVGFLIYFPKKTSLVREKFYLNFLLFVLIFSRHYFIYFSWPWRVLGYWFFAKIMKGSYVFCCSNHISFNSTSHLKMK